MRFFDPRFLWLLLSLMTVSFAEAVSRPRPPNVVLILCDNLGNGDVACFNPKTLHRTPNLDQMAAEGRRLTSFYSASGVCTPSRASLMTGCYPRRIGLHISAIGASVLQPVAARGLSQDEETVAELLKRAGYATACFGKWHLGDQPPFLPTRHGFDTYFGIPYSEDMIAGKREGWPELPLMRDEKVIEAPVDVQHITRRITEEAVKWIGEKKDRPFFLYVPEASPGSRQECYPGPEFRGKSANGLYGDSVEELDWSAGQILAALKTHDLDRSTLVIWTSDNGAVNRNPPQGSNAPYQGTGYTTKEGGQRMPCIVRLPGHVPAGSVSGEVCTMMDVLPTLVRLAGAPSPQKKIDGYDAWSLWAEGGARSPYDEAGFFYYQVRQLQAVRSGPWKLYLPLAVKEGPGKKGPTRQDLALFDVRSDVGEQKEVSAANSQAVERMLALAEMARKTLGDGDTQGTEQREAGWVEAPVPLLLKP